MNPTNRPTARDIEDRLEKFDVKFWKELPIRRSEYIQSSTEDKDKVFLKLWDGLKGLTDF
jgi:hypothetical protein